MNHWNIAKGSVDPGGGADEVRAVHIGFDFIHPTLHQVQFNAMVRAQIFDLFCGMVEVATAPPQATITLRFIGYPFYYQSVIKPERWVLTQG